MLRWLNGVHRSCLSVFYTIPLAVSLHSLSSALLEQRRPGRTHTHTHTDPLNPGAKKRGRDRGLSLLLWSKHSSILCVPLSFPSITPCLLNHSPPISAGFIRGYYLAPRRSVKHTLTRTQIPICTYIVHFSSFFFFPLPRDQLDGSGNVKRLYETRADLDPHVRRHHPMRRAHFHVRIWS